MSGVLHSKFLTMNPGIVLDMLCDFLQGFTRFQSLLTVTQNSNYSSTTAEASHPSYKHIYYF